MGIRTIDFDDGFTSANDPDNLSSGEQSATVSTTDATVTTIATISTSTGNVILVESTLVGARTGGAAGASGDSATYKRLSKFVNDAGVLTDDGDTDVHTNEDQAGWDITLAVSGTDILIQVTGAINNNIDWAATYRTFVEPLT